MKALFDKFAIKCSKMATYTYSTSFSLGIFFLSRNQRAAIHAIYGYVRLADEIVDSFHDFEKGDLLRRFRRETFTALDERISLNPIIHAFQETVRKYNIEPELIETFLRSMEKDLQQTEHTRATFDEYILGSAEVVGLMCLWVFCEGDAKRYAALKKPAMRLGAAFQKVNFLRDLHLDYHFLERTYFPNLDLADFKSSQKAAIEREIRTDFKYALEGIKKLPGNARFGVYLAYVYYHALLKKIERTPGEKLLTERLRIPNYRKLSLLIHSFLRYNFGAL